MRELRKNKYKKLWIGLFQKEEPIYQLKENGEIDTIVMPWGEEPIILGTKPSGYKITESFSTNLDMGGGDAKLTPSGVSISDYEASFVAFNKADGTHKYEITETSLLYDKEPILDENGLADPSEAAWKITKIEECPTSVLYGLERATSTPTSQAESGDE